MQPVRQSTRNNKGATINKENFTIETYPSAAKAEKNEFSSQLNERKMMLSKYTVKNLTQQKKVLSSSKSLKKRDLEPDYMPKKAFGEQQNNYSLKRLDEPAIIAPIQSFKTI
jgi:hypothetical protein